MRIKKKQEHYEERQEGEKKHRRRKRRRRADNEELTATRESEEKIMGRSEGKVGRGRQARHTGHTVSTRVLG